MLDRKQLFLKILKTQKLADGEIEGIIATEDVDRQGEKMDIKGLDIKKFMASGGPVLYGHDYQGLPIGKTESIRKSGGQLIARFKLAIDISQLANQVYDLILGNFLTGLSIGFIGKEFDDENNTWIKSEMLEFSVVPVPANSEAMITAKSKGLKINEIEKFQGKDYIKEIEDKLNIETLLSQVSGLSDQVSALADVLKPAAVTDKTEKKGKRKLVLVTAKKHAQVVDKQVELIIVGVNKILSGADN